MTTPTLPAAEGRPRLMYVSTLDHIVRVMLPHLDAARAAGFTVEVACRVTRFGEDLAAHADAVHDLPFCRFPLHPANVLAGARLVRLLRARPALIVHAHNPAGGFVGRLAATLVRVPVRAYTAHGFHFHRHGGRVANAVYRAAETLAGRFLSDGVLVINREDFDAARRARVVPVPRLFLTGGVGVSVDAFDPGSVTPAERRAVRCEIGAASEATPVLCVVGELIGRKRQADALAALARLRPAHPKILLLIVGDGAKMAQLRACARDLGVENSCRFLGFRRDVKQILAATDVFLFPSQQEGLPCSIQEALAMAVPVVATNVRGNADLVDPTCGRLVPLGDVDALARACADLLALPPAARGALGAAGREKMIRDYERGKCVGQWLAIYQTLLARRGRELGGPEGREGTRKGP